jgi:hypothetical protein
MIILTIFFNSANKIISNKKEIDKEMKRVRKWNIMMSDWDRWMKKNANKIKERVKKGIPDRCRSEAWGKLADLRNIKKKGISEGVEFNLLLEEETSEEDQINKDIMRTFPQHNDFINEEFVFVFIFKSIFVFSTKKLFQTLKAYAVYDPVLGYCQGMAFIAAMLNMYYSSEDSFWMLVILLDDKYYGLRSIYTRRLPKLRLCLNVLEKFIIFYYFLILLFF